MFNNFATMPIVKTGSVGSISIFRDFSPTTNPNPKIITIKNYAILQVKLPTAD